MKTLFRLCCVPCVVFLLCVSSSFAATLKDVVNDMKPIEAFVVDVVDGQIIFDQGSEFGVLKNDLFTVFRAGKKLTDPQTGKVLGQIETRAGLVTVTRVEKQFSYADSVGESGEIKRGDKLVRFKEISAVIQGTTDSESPFVFELQRGLQGINWQDKKTSKTELVFVRKGAILTVKNQQGKVIRNYHINQQQIADAETSSPTSTKTYAPVYATGGIAATVAVASTPENVNSTKKVRYDMETYGYSQEGGLPFSAVMGDFLMIDSQMYLAVIREYEVAVYRIQDKSTELVASIKTPLVKLLAVSWWQPADERNGYLAVTGYDTDEEQVSSMIFNFNKSNLSLVDEELPYILSGNDLDGDSKPEVLFAQGFDRDTFFGRSVRQVQLVGKRVNITPYRGDLPLAYRAIGGAVLDGGKTAAYIVGNRLHIAVGGREVYASGKEMGGSASSVRYVQNPDDINPLFSNAKIEVSPIGVDIDGDGTQEILIPSADLSAFTTVGGANSIKKTWVAVIKKNGNGTYMKGKIGGEYDQYIQGMGAGNGSLYLLTVNAGSIFSESQGGSQLLVLPFAE